VTDPVGWKVEIEGKYYTCKNLRVVPRPVQKPHPPIWQVGSSSKWVERAVRNGWGLVFGGPVPNVVFEEPIRQYHAACESFGVATSASGGSALRTYGVG
jgi:alkanesulfonate monooxygenase SsuD/methylene tetrahydromethanopterin reductase-like flavin-dependent oxidoreductase (luciferase family)